MKNLMLICALFTVTTTQLIAQETSIFFLTEDRTSTYLLEIDTLNETYVFSKHSGKRIQIDKGKFTEKRNRLTFKSEVKYHSFNPYLYAKLFLKQNIMYSKWKDKLLKRNGSSNINIYNADIDYQFSELKEFTSTKRISIEKKSASMKKFRGIQFKDKFMELLANKTPEYNDIIPYFYTGPDYLIHYINDEMVEWDKDVSKWAILDMFTTIVHESVHAANDTNKILIYPDSLLLVERTAVVYTKTMTSFFEEKGVTDSVFRFDTYIKDAEDNLTSNSKGIYGLMDEFCAYYHDVNSGYTLYKYYKALGDTAYKNFMAEDILGSYFAYYEFNLFMGGYLSYLKQHNPSIYAETISNKNLSIAYTELNRQFGNLVKKIETELSDSESYDYFTKYRAKPTKRLMQQFLPELENLKTKTLAKN